MGLSQALAEFVANTKFKHLGTDTVASTRLALLDGLGVSLAATSLGEGCEVFREQALSQPGAGESRVWGTGKKASSTLAALANGALAHALDFEDTHDGALVHPNAAVIPAAIAAAESCERNSKPVTGEQLITAIAVGCDVVCRLGLSLKVPLDQYGWYPPPILSAFGATAAAANIYQLNQRQVLDAFSLTLLQSSCSGEIKYNSDSVVRSVRDAFPAQTGLMSAQLAKRGVKGFDQPFEGKAGFFAMFARGNYDAEPCIAELSERFEINHLSFKKWPSCRGTHVFIEMMAQATRNLECSIDNILRIEATGNGINRMLAEPLQNKQQPTTSIDAKFSIPYCIAWTAVHGAPSLASFLPESLGDQRVIELAKKVVYRVDAVYSDSGSGMLSGKLSIETADGEITCDRDASVNEEKSQELSESELIEKFVHCCAFSLHKLDEPRVSQLLHSIMQLETAEDLEDALFKYL